MKSIGEDLALDPKYICCEHLTNIKEMSDEDIKNKTHWFDAITQDKKELHRLIMCQPCAENWVKNNLSNFKIEGTIQ